ncbi:MAG: TorD/DmsD family molecular chaperone [Shewanella sp.]
MSVNATTDANVCLATIDFLEYQGLARILHHCLIRYPEQKLIQDLKECDIAGSWPEFGLREQNRAGRQLLGGYLQQMTLNAMGEMDAATLIELKLDYGQLFFGPGEPNAVPQGSVYLSEEQLFNDRSTMALIDFYRANGIELQMDFPQPIDHIGLFFAVLDQSFGRLAAEPNNQALTRMIQVLLQLHLLPWAFRCFELAHQYAATDFYRGLALLGYDFLQQLQQDFQILPIATRLYR